MVIFANLAPPQLWRVVRNSAELDAALADSPEAIVCYSLLTAAYPAAAAEWREIKRAYPRVKIIAGGPHPSACPDAAVAAGAATVFVGEAERSLPLFWAAYVRSGRQPWPAVVMPGEPLPLDTIPPFTPRGDWFCPTELTRGCEFHCCYCQTPRLFPPPARHRSAAALRPYLETQVRLGKKRFTVLSPNALGYLAERPATPNLAALEELFATCRAAGINHVIFGTYPGEVRPEYVTPAAAALMRKYCDNNAVSIGAQAVTEQMLKACGRSHSVAAVDSAVAYLAEAGFTPVVDLIFGMPGEEQEDRDAVIAKVKEWLTTVNVKIQAHYFMPLPGTPWAGQQPVPPDAPFLDQLRCWHADGIVQGDWDTQRRWYG